MTNVRKRMHLIVSMILIISLLGTSSVFAGEKEPDYSLSNNQIELVFNDLGMSDYYHGDLEVIASSSRKYASGVTMVCYRLSNGLEIAVEYSGSTVLVAGIYDKEKGELKRISYYRDAEVKTIIYDRDNSYISDSIHNQTEKEPGIDRRHVVTYPDDQTYGTITFAALNSNNELFQTTFTVSGEMVIVFSNNPIRINGVFQDLIDLAGWIADILGGTLFLGNDFASEICEILNLGLSNISVDINIIGTKIENTWSSYIAGTNASGVVSGYCIYGHVQGSSQNYYDYSSDYYDIDSLRDHYVAFANRIFKSIFYFNNTSTPINWNVYY